MGWKIFSIFFVLIAILLLILYWFIPFGTIEFGIKSSNSNFSLANSQEGMQFYDNMRYPNSRISYKIEDCPLGKEDNMQDAFEIIEDETILEFYPVSFNEEISVTCDDAQKEEGGMFIAGEGGPTEIIKAGNFNVIFHGKILLIRESKCSKPNIAIHELLHALGFEHSSNPSNIMYNFSKCTQTIGEDTIEFLNEIYTIPSYSDLIFENVSASMSGRNLEMEMVIRNAGLKDSSGAEVEVYIDNKLDKTIDLDGLKIGHGMKISRTSTVLKLGVSELKLVIVSNFNELDKQNNEIILEIAE